MAVTGTSKGLRTLVQAWTGIGKAGHDLFGATSATSTLCRFTISDYMIFDLRMDVGFAILLRLGFCFVGTADRSNWPAWFLGISNRYNPSHLSSCNRSFQRAAKNELLITSIFFAEHQHLCRLKMWCFCKEDRCDRLICIVPRLKFGGYKMIDVIGYLSAILGL